MDQNQYPVIEKISQLTERYQTKFGRVAIGLFRFPKINAKEFSSFQDSLQTTLRRKELLPGYVWLIDPYQNCYLLVLFVQGYFRDNLDDLEPIITRLWKRHSFLNYFLLSFVILAQDTLFDVGSWFAQFSRIPQCLTEPEQSLPYAGHVRTFGSSQMF